MLIIDWMLIQGLPIFNLGSMNANLRRMSILFGILHRENMDCAMVARRAKQ